MTPPNEQARETPMAELAERLSEAQRRFLAKGYTSDRRGYWPMYNALARKGFVKNERLTPLGSALRSHLMGGSDRGK